MTDEQLNETSESAAITDDAQSDAFSPAETDMQGTPPQYGVGPFSIREVAIGGVWLVAFIVSFFSLSVLRFDSVWTSGLLWILTIGVPTAAVFLLALRRLSPEGIRRVGSLGIDQFASVAFSVATVVWIQLIWETVAVAADAGVWVRTWVIWVEAILMLAGVVLTVFAPLLPVLCEDFRHRPEIVAHRNARPIRRVSPKPAVERAPAAEADPDAEAEDDLYRGAPDGSQGVYAAQPATAVYDAEPTPAWATDTGSFDPRAFEDDDPVETAEQTSPRGVVEAFWALVPVDRDVVDESGAPLFSVGPDAWALVIEERGSAFLVRHEDGRIGYLHDTSGVTRG